MAFNRDYDAVMKNSMFTLAQFQTWINLALELNFGKP